MIRFGPGEIRVERALASLGDRGCGGIAVFLGVVRNTSEGRRVTSMEYHGYPEMAEKVLARIEKDLRRSHGAEQVVLWHRTGRLRLGEASVLVGAAAPHRAEAFAACREGIERIKAELPVWKKEFGAGGAVWKEERALTPGRRKR